MRLRESRNILAACVASFAMASCITAPRQTVELADIVAEQAAALEQSHRAIVNAYFVELERRIDDFVDNRWTPGFLARAVASEQVRSAMEQARAGLAIDPEHLRSTIVESREFSQAEAAIIVRALENAQFDYRVEFGQIMVDFSAEALRQINERRQSLKAPIEDNRRQLLTALDAGYADLQAGQATLRAYLSSVVQLVEEQDLVLQKLNLLRQRDSVMDTAVKASTTAAEVATKLSGVDGRFKDLAKVNQ